MDKARAAVSDFMHKAGHHDTTVHESVAPAVTQETIKPTKHENITTAIDKEVHQDHYHTSVQPVVDRQVLPEQHHHNVVPVEHREFHHGKDHDVKGKLAETAAQFKSHQTIAPTQETRSAVPTVAGEHIHHHVHETIQPVVQKETIQPHVVHTTVPIHEVHHSAPQHHGVSALPAVSMTDFNKQGGSLHGREERFDGFEGEPRGIGGHHTGTGAAGVGTGVAAGGIGSKISRHHHKRTDSNSSFSSSDEERGTHNTRGLRRKQAAAGGVGGVGAGHHGTTGSSTNPQQKTGLMAKLDPRVDSNGDGKAGFMK